MSDDDPSSGFRSTCEHAVRLQAKAEDLRAKAKVLDEQCKLSLEVAAAMIPQISVEACRWAVAYLAEQKPKHRRIVIDVARKRIPGRPRGADTHKPGEKVWRHRRVHSAWPTAPAWVYALWSDDPEDPRCLGELLYIGKSVRPSLRMQEHGRRMDWAWVQLIACADEPEALRLEADLIYQHQPRFNRSARQSRRYDRVPPDSDQPNHTAVT